MVLPSPPIPAMAISPKRDKAEKAEVKTSKGNSKQAIGRLKTNLLSFNSACVALSKGIENSEAEVTTQTVVSQLQTVAKIIDYRELIVPGSGGPRSPRQVLCALDGYYCGTHAPE